ncbi:hypothetical protein RJ640_010106 [Escallonia rubra]|uniref:Transcriptional factor DELLA N-terminal domain-containing protein n=1 Tax=Escallonia rubra TaxID=112253 RepID=A0AA88SCH8_9ASTE|nr:hypothetical protein RJ640_010106 [Escallonia rubra]
MLGIASRDIAILDDGTSDSGDSDGVDFFVSLDQWRQLFSSTAVRVLTMGVAAPSWLLSFSLSPSLLCYCFCYDSSVVAVVRGEGGVNRPLVMAVEQLDLKTHDGGWAVCFAHRSPTCRSFKGWKHHWFYGGGSISGSDTLPTLRNPIHVTLGAAFIVHHLVALLFKRFHMVQPPQGSALRTDPAHPQNMGLYYSSISAGSIDGGSSSCSGKPADPIDGLLAGAGYRVLSSELWQVARCLETVMVNAPTEVSHLANDSIHYNPSDVASWVDSLLSKLHKPKKPYPTRQPSQI